MEQYYVMFEDGRVVGVAKMDRSIAAHEWMNAKPGRKLILTEECR